ncbi:HipA domain-containing protein [Xiamenia xianingshaonis]|uniref:Type II toxin-antitoxin system HipA family toxin n=1 Tax=Xiamenia xianingshaonis TaxID=2682776 RepID=A0ABX0IJ82_9ACTN|nr:HipA domain-containing protein [Xiamenia xianingshaonis]NHM13515.1 hypothetical protein [Xiamenia xianingshaonis]
MRLSVFGEIDGERVSVGVLETLPQREEQFSYARSFIDRFPDRPLSVRLPVRQEPFTARQSRPFFQNLLPEGAALAAVAKALEVKRTSYTKILNALGNECIGAVVVMSEEDEPKARRDYLPISYERLGAAMAEGAGGMARLQEKAKLSLAGAQSKMGFCIDPEKPSDLFMPQGTAASTHVAKTSDRRFAQLSENEHYCLTVAKASGMKTAKSTIALVDGQPVFMTERFDRVVSADVDELPSGTFRRVLRRHQEDFCQVLGKLPERKYEQPGQHYARDVCATLASRSEDPLADASQFVRSLIVNAILGNCDGHLKNYTAVRGTNWKGFALAPAYDIASTVVYDGLDRHMAMRIGSTNRVDDVSRDDFMMLAEELSMSKRTMMRLVDECCEGVAQAKDASLKDLEATLGRPLEKLREASRFAQRQIDRLGF